MTRLLAVLTSSALLAAVAHAQCVNSTGATPAGLIPTGTFYPAHDEGLSPPIDMLFGGGGFPLPGGVGGPFTHAVIESNGVIYLTNGGPAVGNPSFGPGGLASVRGIGGDSPRIMPLWHDAEGFAPTWTVDYDTSVPGQFTVLWRDVEEYFSGGPQYTFSATLYSSGVVEYSYGTLPALPINEFLPAFVGISIGNGVGTGSETSVDLTQNPDSGTLGLIFQEFDGTVPSVSATTITLLPNGMGGYLSALTCQSARHVAYGAGCHDTFLSPTDTFYELFPDAAAASAGLTGNAMILTPTVNGYVASWIPGGAAGLYLPPTGGATSLVPNDDGDEDVALPSPFPAPHGSFSSLRVGHNGIITLAGVANNAFDYSPDGVDVANAAEAAFYSWSDFRDTNTTPVPSGTIKTELVGSLFCITWDNVDHWTSPTQTTAPSTLQFQFDLTTGNVFYVWVTINNDTSSTFGSAHLIGYTGPGAGIDPGSITLSSALPMVAQHNVNSVAMSLSAAPAPVINPSTMVTFTADNLPEFVPGSGVYISTLFFSVNPLPGGFDLAGILTTVPGCNAYIATLDVDLGGQLTFAPTASWNFVFDNVIFAPGNQIASQAVGLFDPAFPLPNGEAGGFLVSNGVRSVTQAF